MQSKNETYFVLQNQGGQQCDQIGRICALWVIVYFGQIFENKKVAHVFVATFSTAKDLH
jgi:hypothetical protein